MRAQPPRVFPRLVAVLTALLAFVTIAGVAARQPQGAPVTVDKDDLGVLMCGYASHNRPRCLHLVRNDRHFRAD